MSSMVAAAAAAAASSRLTPTLSAVSVTDLLEANEKSLWKLRLFREPTAYYRDFSRFRNALVQNTVVTSVDLKWKFLQALTENNRVLLLQTIGATPQIEEIIMDAVESTSALAEALKIAVNLKSLSIEKLRFLSNEDIVDLSNALRCCSSLQQISVSSLQVMVQRANLNNNDILDAAGIVSLQETAHHRRTQNEITLKLVLDPLLDAMASLPRLEHVRLQHYLSGGNIQPPSESSLRSLCHAPRKVLIFNSCGLSDHQCMVIANELKRVDPQQTSSILSVLVVTRNYQITSRGWDAFVEMLKTNCNIVDFHHGEDGQPNAPSTEQLAKIMYYTKLNIAGRGRLLRSMSSSRRAWVDDFLIKWAINDIGLLFFALQTNPWLCNR